MLLGRTNVAGPRLVGVDRAATDRCIAAVARHLRHIPNERPYAKFARYGGVWAKGDRRILSRVHTYRRLTSAAPKLTAEVRAALGLKTGTHESHRVAPSPRLLPR
jgi:hypothetical protein